MPFSSYLELLVIARCLERRRTLIDDHHNKQGLDNNHNLKSYYARLKANNLTDSNDG